MAKDNSASIVTLHQALPKRAMTPAERAKKYRLRKKARAMLALAVSAPGARTSQNIAGGLLPERIQTAGADTLPVTQRVTSPAAYLCVTAAFALAATGIVMNGWFARSLGSSEVSGWLFLAIGVAADAAALAVPSCAARLWVARQRATALAGWAVFAVTFAFAVTSGIGFASTNISDVTLSRASRSTPAVVTAREALADAMAARDRECNHRVGPVCRQREEVVNDRRHMLDIAVRAVEQTGDPQTQAAVHIAAWLSGGLLKPSGDDFAMLRLVLLAILPQIGGILLMIGRFQRS